VKSSLLTAALVVSLSAVAAAQNVSPSISVGYRDVPGPVGYGAYNYGYGYGYHSSTLQEGVLRGVGAMARGIGSYNLDTARAKILQQQAYSLELDNRQKKQDTYFEMRRRNREQRAAEELPQPTTEDIRRYAKAYAPERMTNYEVDPVEGRIYWPATLEGPQYAELRQQAETLFAHRSQAAAGNSQVVAGAVSHVSEQMQQILKDQIGALTTRDYLAAKKFLVRLANEARFAPQVDGIASR